MSKIKKIFISLLVYISYLYFNKNIIKYLTNNKMIYQTKKKTKACVVTQCNFPKDDNHPGYLLPNKYLLCNETSNNISMEEYVNSQEIIFKKSNIPIIFINMKKSKLRKKTIKKSLQRFFNSVIRFEALTPEDEVVKKYVKQFRDVNEKVVAVTLSHYYAINYAFKNLDSEYVIISEDDVSTSFHPFWTQSLDAFINTFPNDTEAIQLFSSMFTYDHKPIYKKKNIRPVSENNEYGAVIYLLTRKGMNIISKMDLSILHNNCKHFTADDCLLSFTPYDQWSGHTFYKSFTIHPSLFSLGLHISTFNHKERDILNGNIYCSALYENILFFNTNYKIKE